MEIQLMLAALAALLVFHLWASRRPARLWYLGGIAPLAWIGVLIWMGVSGVFAGDLWGLLAGGLAPLAVLLGLWAYGRQAADARDAESGPAGEAE